MITLPNIFQAYTDFAKGKRNKKDVVVFSQRLEEHLFSLHEDLRTGQYKHGPYNEFTVRDPKMRKISKASVRDRVVHHLIAKKLEEIFESTFIYDSYASRQGKGLHSAIARFKIFSQGISHNYHRPFWVLQCDIEKFFASVDHTILLEILKEKIADTRFLLLLENIIGSFNRGSLRGIPLGNLTSQIFSNIYLNRLDQYIKHRLHARYYIRYCDDFLIFDSDREGLLGYVGQIQRFLKDELNLQLHPEKVTIRKNTKGVDFLGYVIFPKHTIIRTNTWHRIQKSLGVKGVVDHRKVHSYLAILKHCSSYTKRKQLCRKIVSK